MIITKYTFYKMCTITSLPIDVLGIIFSYLDLEIVSLIQLKKTCKQFNEALNSPKLATLWHGKYQSWWSNRITSGGYTKRLRLKEEPIMLPRAFSRSYCDVDNRCRDE